MAQTIPAQGQTVPAPQCTYSVEHKLPALCQQLSAQSLCGHIPAEGAEPVVGGSPVEGASGEGGLSLLT